MMRQGAMSRCDARGLRIYNHVCTFSSPSKRNLFEIHEYIPSLTGPRLGYRKMQNFACVTKLRHGTGYRSDNASASITEKVD